MSVNYLSYSGYKSYEQCPYAYWHKYIVKTKPKVPENGVNALYGTTIGTVFESFYRDSIWKSTNIEEILLGLAEPHLDKAIKDAKRKGRDIYWMDEKANYHSKEEIMVDLRATIPIGIQTIRENRLVGPRMDAEFKLDRTFDGYILGGRADFIIMRVKPFSDLVILDGKGSKHRGNYVDGHFNSGKIEGIQLKLYGMLFKEATGVMPGGLGYIFWRFSGDQAIEWVDFSEKDFSNLKGEFISVVKRIDQSSRRLSCISDKPQAHSDLRQELFPAQPGSGCMFCEYVTFCEEGQKQQHKSRPRPRLNLPEGVTELTLGSDD